MCKEEEKERLTISIVFDDLTTAEIKHADLELAMIFWDHCGEFAKEFHIMEEI